ncbi:MAG: hypothetical protein ACE5HY_04350 [Candidatus Hydrothermarchaeales archaeon]
MAETRKVTARNLRHRGGEFFLLGGKMYNSQKLFIHGCAFFYITTKMNQNNGGEFKKQISFYYPGVKKVANFA